MYGKDEMFMAYATKGDKRLEHVDDQGLSAKYPTRDDAAKALAELIKKEDGDDRE